ncbi:GNA1162 family protein [Thermosulfurimonas sp. F29]|uniref:GNA1162 family protein n=1 Tax=Thermosulfurimonas sp. F29 TaxID=2867247 RepID=UPI001C838C84|nr:GNA1162 family protein [Thermosulfurimonas sp. F29]MBX6422062.1 CsgG/HfaB family protein [Thermosulfurimonas sp. F29]
MRRCLAGFLLLFFLAGCASRGHLESYMREGVDPTFVKKVAVLKFENHTREKEVAERMRDIVTMEALALGLFDVVDRTVVDEVLAEEGVEGGMGLDRDTVRRLGKRLGVQALLVGSVNAYETEREGSYSYPVVSLSLRLLDVASGEIIWKAGGTETGYSLVGRLFGFKPRNAIEVSFDLAAKLLKTFR